MTTKTQNPINKQALETAIIEALKWNEQEMPDFPALSSGDLNEVSFIRYKALKPNNRPHKVKFNFAFNELLEDLVKRNHIKSYKNRFMHQYRLAQPKLLPIDTLSNAQCKLIHKHIRALIDTANSGTINGGNIYISSNILTYAFDEEDMLELMGIAAKTKPTL